MSRPATPQSTQKSTENASSESQPAEARAPSPPPLAAVEKKPDVPAQEPSATKNTLVLVTAFLCMFLVGLDRTIISTAIPQITNDFNSLSDVGWYGSGYLLTCCAFQLFFGKIYAFFSVKATYIASIVIFMVSSAISGAAPNSDVFIVGRAICGVGAAGMFAGTTMAVVYTVPLAKRPRIQGIMGAVGGFSTILGPLIGGGFTTHVSWRWCFYINLPLCGVTIPAIYFLLNIPDRDTTKLPLPQKLSQLDAPGTAFLVPSVVSLLLALQWGGQTYSWSSGRIIALLTVFSVLFVGFFAVQTFLPKTATIPPKILKQRSIAAGLLTTICVGSAQYIFIYYLPIWFQSIKGVEAVQSGIRLFPLMIAFAVASMAGGFINQKIGYYTPLAIIGSSIMSVGAGLLTTLQVHTASGKWIGFQILFGFGMGFCFSTPNLAVQTVLPKKEVPMGIALMFFGQLLGAAVFVSVGENVLTNQLIQRLSGLPGFDSRVITSGGATALLSTISQDQRETALIAYNEALRKVFQIGLILSCLSVLGTSSLEWKSVLKKPQANPGAEKGAAGGAAGENKVGQKA